MAGPDYYDLDKVHAELQRQFDVCHTCRRCFNLCDSFPRMFDAIDEGPTGEIDGIGPRTTPTSPRPARSATCAS
jgi:glycerol-3-phosphate dehydrogenase subunit C